MAGFDIPEGTKFFIVPETGTGPDYPFSGEKLTVTMTLYRVKDIDEAIAMTNRIQAYQGQGHSCGIYSRSDANIMKLAEATRTCRVMVNQPQSASNSGNLWNGMRQTFSLGCGSWGGTGTSNNINWRDLINETWVSKPLAVPKTLPSDEELFGDVIGKLGCSDMSQFDLTDEQRQIQEMARQFTADAITPHAAEWDEKHIFPRETIQSAAELGFGSIYVSEESGGIGLGRLEAALIMEAMAYGCPSTSAFISIHNMASWMIDRFGSQAVKDKYLPSMVTMERIGSYCLTEPGSGSDAAALKTKAVKDGDHYVVTGSKAFISGGGENEIYVSMVRTGVDGPKGISCLVIEKDMAGRQLRRAGEEARLAFAADRAGQFRRASGCRPRTSSAARARASGSR